MMLSADGPDIEEFAGVLKPAGPYPGLHFGLSQPSLCAAVAVLA